MKVRPLVALDVGATKVACAIGLPHPEHQGTTPPWRGGGMVVHPDREIGMSPHRGVVQGTTPLGGVGLHEQSRTFELLGSSLVSYPTLSETWLGDPLMVGHAIEQALEATGVTGDFTRALVAMNHPLLTSESVRVAVTLGDEPTTVRMQDLDRLHAAALHQVLGVDREPLMVERLGCAGNGFEGVRDPWGLSATRLAGTFHIVTMPMAARRALVQAVESAGLEVMQLTYTLAALWVSTSDERVSRKHVLLIDVGGLTTDVGLVRDGILHATAIVPWGGLTLSGMIARDFHVTVDQAMAWSLEGTACRKPAVRTLIEGQWGSLQQAIETVLKGQPRPHAVLVSGRGSLIDGFVEWLERTLGIPTSLCRSPHTSRIGDLSRQLALGPAVGLLDMATRTQHPPLIRSTRMFNRLIDRTRILLTEYF